MKRAEPVQSYTVGFHDTKYSLRDTYRVRNMPLWTSWTGPSTVANRFSSYHTYPLAISAGSRGWTRRRDQGALWDDQITHAVTRLATIAPTYDKMILAAERVHSGGTSGNALFGASNMTERHQQKGAALTAELPFRTESSSTISRS